jgi:type IV pilus assembly protein PilO
MRSIKSQTAWCVRAQWTMTLVMVSLTGLFFVVGYRPANQRLNNLRAEIAARSGRLETNQSRAVNLPILAAEVATLEAKLQKNNKKLPKTLELGEFIGQMTLNSQQCNLRKLVHQPGAVRRLELYSEIPITMNFEGDFSSVFSFLREMEAMPRLTRVKSLNIRTKDAKLGVVDVNMAMNIYFSEL